MVRACFLTIAIYSRVRLLSLRRCTILLDSSNAEIMRDYRCRVLLTSSHPRRPGCLLFLRLPSLANEQPVSNPRLAYAYAPGMRRTSTSVLSESLLRIHLRLRAWSLFQYATSAGRPHRNYDHIASYTLIAQRAHDRTLPLFPNDTRRRGRGRQG